MIRAFKGFNVENPQHVIWLKRKIANRDRYERKFARRQTSKLKTFRCKPHYLQSRPPTHSYWWTKEIAMQRDAITGKPVMKSRLAWWIEAHREQEKGKVQ